MHTEQQQLQRIRRTRDVLLRQERLLWWLCVQHARGDKDYGRDLMQEIGLTLCRYVDRLRPDASKAEERAWVKKVARTVLHNHKRKQRIELLPLQEELVAVSDDDGNSRELVDELQAYLPEADKLLLKLHLEGFGNTEIAKILNLTDNAVNQRMHRLVEKMRIIYEKLYNTRIQWKHTK